jgi:hypothetical protein
MTTININNEVYAKWKNHYAINVSKLEFPTLKNYTEKSLLKLIESNKAQMK